MKKIEQRRFKMKNKKKFQIKTEKLYQKKKYFHAKNCRLRGK